MSKKKNSSKKEKSNSKSAREALRFQVMWEAKKWYPNAGNELSERINWECSIAEEISLLPCFKQGKEFLDIFRKKFTITTPIKFSSFLQHSLLARFVGLTSGIPLLGDENKELFAQAMLQDPLTIDIVVNGADIPTVYHWLMRSGNPVRKYTEGMEVLIDALSFRFPIVDQLQAIFTNKAQAFGIAVNETGSQRIAQEIRTFINITPEEHLPELMEMDKLGDCLLQIRQQLQSKSDIRYSDITNNTCALVACCLGCELPTQSEAWKGETTEVEICGFVHYLDYIPAMKTMKKFFTQEIIFVPNGWIVGLSIIKLKLNFAGAFHEEVKTGIAKHYNKVDKQLETRLTAEQDWYEQSGILSDILLLKLFVQEATESLQIAIGSGTALLEHSIVAYCLDLTPDAPDLNDEDDLQFFIKKKHSVREVNVYFASERYDDIVGFAQGYFGEGKENEKFVGFNLGKLTLKLYKERPELPTDVKWYRLGTMQKMFEYYSKYSYSY